MFKQNSNTKKNSDAEATGANKQSKAAKHTKRKPRKKRHLFAKVVGVGVTATAATGATAVLGSYGAWQYAKQQFNTRRLYTPAFSGVITPQRFTGKVQKVGDHLTFVTEGATYALVDPLLRIPSLYQSNKTPTQGNAAKQHKLMDQVHCDEMTIIAELSEKGHYGYLGHLDYQLTVVETADHQMNF